MIPNNSPPFKDIILAFAVLLSISGCLALAVVDEESRSPFIDLSKFVIGAYVGLIIPRK